MARGHTAPSNRKSRIPVVIGGYLVVRPSQQQSVVKLRRLAKPFQNRVWDADGTGWTCELQIVAHPAGESVPRTDRKMQ